MINVSFLLFYFRYFGVCMKVSFAEKKIQKATQVKNFSVERKNMTILLYVTFLRTLLIYIFPFHPFCSVPIFLNTNEYFLLIHIIIIIIIIQHEKSSIFLLVFIKCEL